MLKFSRRYPFLFYYLAVIPGCMIWIVAYNHFKYGHGLSQIVAHFSSLSPEQIIGILSALAAVFSAFAAFSSASIAKQAFTISRPWLFVTKVDCEEAENDSFSIMVTIANTGKSPALDIFAMVYGGGMLTYSDLYLFPFGRTVGIISDGASEVVQLQSVGNREKYLRKFRKNRMRIKLTYFDPTSSVYGKLIQFFDFVETDTDYGFSPSERRSKIT